MQTSPQMAMFSTFLIGVTLTCLGFCYYDEWESAFHCTFFFLNHQDIVLLWFFTALSNSYLGTGK